VFTLEHRLDVVDLIVEVKGVRILKGITLSVRSGEIHALMGPNGSGKSTLSYAIMGHPKYRVVRGDILLDGKSILNLPPDKRAKLGLFLAFQNPVEIPGAKFEDFLTLALLKRYDKSLKHKDVKPFIAKELEVLGLEQNHMERGINEGFSGGEKKRAEILQLKLLKPKIAVLDESDSGLDVDGVKAVAKAISEVHSEGTGILLITHYARILNYIKPTKVSVMVDGKIVAQGGPELAYEIEERGYEEFLKVKVK